MWHGWASRRDGQWEQALASFRTALELNPRIHFNWIEYGLTNLYLGRMDEAQNAVESAAALDVNHYWTKSMQARLAMVRGDIDAAVRFTTGAQHTDETGFVYDFLIARILAGKYEEALEVARELDSSMEINRESITLREEWTALILSYDGRKEGALEAARAAMFRLNRLRADLGEDYRILQAESRLSPVLGESVDQVRIRAEKARIAEPSDAVEYFRNEVTRARALAMTGLAAESAEILDQVLSGPNELSPALIDVDPAFDAIRNETEFIEMLDKHR